MIIIILVVMLVLVDAYRCVNFYGLEVEQQNFVCYWKHEPGWYLKNMKDVIKIDSVRLPFSYEYITNTDMSRMDDFIRLCRDLDIDIILDYHRGYASHQGPSPVEEGISENMWIGALLYVLSKYEPMYNVKAITLFNEFQGNDTVYAEEMQREAVNIIEYMFPGRFEYMLGCVDWGKNCTGMWTTLPTESSWVEVHSYGFSVAELEDYHNKVFVGEFGWTQSQLSNYTIFRDTIMRKGIHNVCLWTVAHSHDTEGLYHDDCETINEQIAKQFNELFERVL